ncbi:beta strand repeat-containing protein, partial [Caulobacter sp.]|uniref:beta strand repeat-containing protein n=1 Tax=Caulobacter sp. TaxID=78 RepID=UPI002B45E20A
MYVKDFGSSDDVYAGDEGAPDLVDLVNGGAGDDNLSGGLGDDTLNGQADDDILNGGAGDDTLDGGDGDDTAVFSGAAGDYVWSGTTSSATITGPDGTDTLHNVEHLKFGATIIDLPAPNTAPSAPTDGDGAANTIAEGAATGAVVAGLTLSAVDPDASQTLTWSLLNDAGGRFAIDPTTGVVTVADASKLNFETAASHQITVQVSDGTAVSSASFTIAVTNVAPTAPADSDAAPNTVAEGAVNGAVVAGLSVAATDPNGGVIYSLTDNAGGRFAIDSATGVVTVADASKLNFETAASHQITVQASDGTAVTATSFTIAVTDVPMAAPADTNAAANTVSEAATNGTVVSGLTIVAADPNGGVTYSLVDDAGGRFAINAATGAVTVADASLLDYEAAASHQITVRASDGSATADTTFTIDVANAPPTTPVDVDTAANTVSEDVANGALVGITASASEPKTGTVSYSLSNDAGGRFAIDPTTGVVTVADASKLNFETAASHQITVRATDGQGAFSSRNFTVAITNIANGAPQDDDAADNTISEGAVNGDAVVGLTITTPDINGGPLVYSLLDDAGGRFAINASTGVVTVADASLLNFETATSHQIVVKAASGAESASTAFTIAVTNAAPATPADVNGAANTVIENAPNNSATGVTIAAPDPHGGAVTYSLTNNAGGRFAINATTGVVTVINGALLDHDVQSTHTITVQASDGVLTSSSDIVITLIDKIDSYWTGTTAANTFTVPDVQDWQLEGLAGVDTLTGGVGDDIIIGGTGDDILAGGSGNDAFLVAAGDGADTFDGGAGYDTIKASSDNVTITIKSMTGIEAFALNGFVNVNIAGTSVADTLDFSGVTIPWTPTISAGAGNDIVYGTAGADNIKGEAGLDDLRGGAGNDTLDGGDGADSLSGGDGNDTLIGGTGNDSMSGGNGDDLFLMGVSSGVDWVEGDAGYDTVQASADNTIFSFSMLRAVEVISSGGFANVTLPGTSGADNLDFGGYVFVGTVTITGGAGNDWLFGSASDDTIKGDAGEDWIRGQAGNDTLDGGDALDNLEGGDGNDTLIGGAGNDLLYGG